jgi:hypothetical protein
MPRITRVDRLNKTLTVDNDVPAVPEEKKLIDMLKQRRTEVTRESNRKIARLNEHIRALEATDAEQVIADATECLYQE